MEIRKKIYYLREYFFPFGCGSCGRDLLKEEDAFYGLCPECRSFFISLIGGQGLGDAPLDTSQKITLEIPGGYNQGETELLSFFPYAGSFKTLLGSYKFDKSLGIGNFFALCLNQGLGSFDPALGAEIGTGAAWVPVPPRPGKIKKQGWDQISFLAGLLKKQYARYYKFPRPAASSLPAAFRLPVNSCLKRLPSKSQKELNKKDREENLKGRIICVKLPPKTAIIFDDVITTGATLKTCAQALLKGGAEKVHGLCLFYD